MLLKVENFDILHFVFVFFLFLLVCYKATCLDSILEESLTFLKVKRKVVKHVVSFFAFFP